MKSVMISFYNRYHILLSSFFALFGVVMADGVDMLWI